ncbi:kynurenine formamidase-like [Actinia tenebrosa]|uniref:Kynurenine formamidase-like n=1 Tax=Actinia tenebrosa TaxID=6105 RepID=A0A6P8HJK2_ACTTE|nr:kynurenine formamidase-like [Actinia tenebrosa]
MTSKQDMDEDVENEYTCSRWVRDIPVDLALSTYINQWAQMTSKARESFDVELNICYGNKEECTLDVYRTKETLQNAAVFIFFHGGYWQESSKDEYAPPIFAAMRAAAFTVMVEYQLAPKATLDEIVAQVKSAVKFVAKRFPESPLYLCGHSAGAHLSAMMMIQESWEDADLPKRIKGMCLVSGVYDLLPLLKTTINTAVKMNEESAKRNSPALQLKLVRPSLRCPVILPVGEYESPSLHNQSKSMLEILKSHGMECKYFDIPKCDHFSILSKLTSAEFQLSKELYQMLTEKH